MKMLDSQQKYYLRVAGVKPQEVDEFEVGYEGLPESAKEVFTELIAFIADSVAVAKQFQNTLQSHFKI